MFADTLPRHAGLEEEVLMVDEETVVAAEEEEAARLAVRFHVQQTQFGCTCTDDALLFHRSCS